MALGYWLYIHLWLCVQVKPLLQVTNTEEKLNIKEQELRQVADHFDRLKSEHQELEQNHKQLAEEKVALVQQLQAEQELCAEAEEVKELYCPITVRYIAHSAILTALFTG